MDAKQRFSVLLDDPSSLATSLMKIARVVAQTLKEHPTDVAQKVRYGGGIVVRDVPAVYAKEIARGLAALGLGSFLVQQEAFQAPPRPRRVGQLEFGPDGIVIAQLLRQPEGLAWTDVLAIHAHASIESTSGEDDEAPARRGGDMTLLSEAARKLLGALREFEDRERARVILGLDLIVKGPVLYRMTSIEAGIYGSLSNLSTIAIENYLSLVRELTGAAASNVLVPASTRRFVLDHDFTRVLYSKREELEAVNAWLLQAVVQGLEASEHEPEDLSDEGLEDAEDAIPVAPSGTGDDDDADEIDDAELEDEQPRDAPLDHSSYDDDDDLADDELDDEDLADDTGSTDPDVAEAAKLFDKTGRFKAADVQAILADVKQLSTTEVDVPSSNDPDADPEVREALGFFETQPSGKWEVKKVLEADQAERDEKGDAAPGAPRTS
jgi:hypothetical protein